MKYYNFYNKLGCYNADQVFDFLCNTLKPTIKSWEYFVDWAKVIRNFKKYDNELNLLNVIIGHDDPESKALEIFNNYPRCKKVIPILLASRDKDSCILTEYKNEFRYKNFVFDQNLSSQDAVSFLLDTGVLKLFQDKTIKSIPDYVLGVEAGLDSNGRKNRGGKRMEQICEYFISELCNKNKWSWLKQATKNSIKKEWGLDITTEKANRTIDFAVNTNNVMFLIETNFYEGGGSKLKSTAGEYRSDHNRWKKDGHEFIWITDGKGWITAKKPLRETFDLNDHIINLEMVEKEILKYIIESKT